MMKRARRRGAQLTLDEARRPTGRGGWRPNAGRKATGKRVGPRHRPRPELSRHHPVHVVLKAVPEVGRLRRAKAYRAIRAALARALARGDFRVIHVSVQHNHIHLIVEADDRAALTRGIQGLSIAAAKRLNAELGRARGRVFLHRYHSTILTAPRQVRHCLAYVLNNWRRHRQDRGVASSVDRFSSGVSFDGWKETGGIDFLKALPVDYEPLPVSRPQTWLLSVGWRRHGLISVREVPGERARRLVA